VVRNWQVAVLLATESLIVDNASVFKTKTMKSQSSASRTLMAMKLD
jgi:hypothetical protein